MKKWFNNNKLVIIGAILGAVAGYVYWNLVGCTSGTCAITSKPVNSTLYGALMGGLLLNIFQQPKNKKTEQ